MKRIVIFDLDGTLCPIGGGITKENQERIEKIRERGLKIAICSGKPVSYLTGICRQLGWNDMILLGENGSVLQIGGSYPPVFSKILPYSQKIEKKLKKMKEDLQAMLPDLWFQPNTVALTPFPKSPQEFDLIEDYLQGQEDLDGIRVFRHVDSFDLIPESISKYEGLKMLTDCTGISGKEMIAVGDGVNDIPMFRYAGLSLGISFGQENEVDYNFETLDQALDFLLENVI